MELNEKTTLRRSLLQVRHNIQDKEQLNNQLTQNIVRFLSVTDINSVAAYWAIRGEFDILPLLTKWQQQDGKRKIYLPQIDTKVKSLQLKQWYPGAVMQQDKYGACYPLDTADGAAALWFIPCVGYNKQGFRLGYGGGYFDRALAVVAPKPILVGIAYAVTQVSFSAERHDQPLDYIISDKEIISFSSKRQIRP